MEGISEKREQQIKLTIIGGSIFFLMIIVTILFWTGIIQFNWSNNLIKAHEYEKNKEKDKKVLIIGDSQLEKWPQIDCLYKMMETYCSENDVGYVNVAHYGFGPIEYLDRIQLIAPDFKPDLIILFYYVGNDLTDVMLRNDDTPKKPSFEYETIVKNMREYEKIRKNDDVIKQRKVEVENNTEFDWESFRMKGIDSTMIEYAKNRILNPYEIGPEYVNPYIMNMAIWNDSYLIDNSMIKSIASKNAWFNILKKFEDILLISEDLNSQICIVAIPSTVQVDDSHFEFYNKNTFKVPNELTSSNQAQLLLSEFSSASEVKYLDLLPHFKKYETTQNLYFENDDHLSEAGHRYAFDRVKQEVLEPFIFNSTNQLNKERQKDYYKKYINWAIMHKIKVIKNDAKWFKDVKEKAKNESVSIESMLYNDAKYSVESEM